MVTTDSTVDRLNTLERFRLSAARPVDETILFSWSNTPTASSSSQTRAAASTSMIAPAIDSMNVTFATDHAFTWVSDRFMRRARGVERRGERRDARVLLARGSLSDCGWLEIERATRGALSRTPSCGSALSCGPGTNMSVRPGSRLSLIVAPCRSPMTLSRGYQFSETIMPRHQCCSHSRQMPRPNHCRMRRYPRYPECFRPYRETWSRMRPQPYHPLSRLRLRRFPRCGRWR